MAVRIRICRSGWYYAMVVAAIFAGALFRQVNLLVILSGIIMSPLVLGWLLAWRTLRRLEVERMLPSQATAGETLCVSYSVVNPRRRLGSWAIVVEDGAARERTSSGSEAAEAIRLRVLFPHIAAGARAKGSVRVMLPRRGRYRFEGLRISTRFPFGFFSAERSESDGRAVLVLPRLGRLGPGWSARRRSALIGAQQRAGQRGREGDFFGLREWHRGDGLRRVAWRAAAKRGAPVVRDLEQPRNRDAALLLDLSRTTGSDDDDLAVERAVGFAATVAADLCRRGGGALWLLTTDARFPPLCGAASGMLLKDALERLALVEACPGDRSAALIEQAAEVADGSCEIVWIAARPISSPGVAAVAAFGLASRLTMVDMSQEQWRQFFDWEERQR